jgi:hypothetical protein
MMRHFSAGWRSGFHLANARAEIVPADHRFAVTAENLFVARVAPSSQVNHAPVVDLNSGTAGIDDVGTYTENANPSRLRASLSVSDADGDMIAGATVRITDPETGDLLSVTGALLGGITVDPGSTALELKLIGSASAANYAAALRLIGFSNTGDDPRPAGTDPYRNRAVTVNDGTVDSAVATMKMGVNRVNDAPAGTDATYTLNQNSSYVLTADKFGFVDIEGNGFLGVIFTTVPAAGTLYYDSDGPGGAAATVIAAGRIVADLAPGHIYYVSGLSDNGTPYASFTFQVQDDGGEIFGGKAVDPSPNTITFNLTSQVDPTPAPTPHIPVVDLNVNTGGVNDAGSFVESGAPLAIGAAISVFDVDGDAIAGATVTITNPAPGDLLSIAGTLPAGISVDPSSTALQVKLIGSASAAAYTVALAQIGYSNTTENPRPVASEPYRYIAVTVNDGTADSATATMRVTVFGTNDFPSGADVTHSFDQDTAYALTADSFGFSDVDSVIGGVIVTTLPGLGSLYYDADGPGGAAAIVVMADQRISDLAPGHFYYTPAPGASGAAYASFTFRVFDSLGTADATPNTLTFNVTQTVTPPADDPANHRPVVDLNTGTPGIDNRVTYLENAAPTRIGTAISVIDDEGAPITGATATIVNPAAGDLVSVIGALPAGISIDPSSTATLLKLTGSATAAAYATALAQIGYSNTGENPTLNQTNVNRYIQVTVNDGNADSLAASVQVTTTGINDDPAGTDATYTVAPGTTYALNADAFGFTDVDGGTFWAVTLETLPTGGALNYYIGPEGVPADVTEEGVFISADRLTQGHLYFRPDPNGSGAPVSFTFSVWDTNPLTNATGVDRSPNTITFNVNVAPVATHLDTAETYFEDTRLRLSEIAITDGNGGDTITATLTLSNPAAGKLSTGTSGAVTATYNAATGVWTAVGGLADVNALISKVQFKPAANFSGDFTIATSVTDGYSAPLTGIKSFTGTAVNDAPAGTDTAMTVTRGVNHVVTAAEFGFSDLEGNAFTGVTIAGQPTGGRLLLDGAKLTAGQLITAADIAAGKLVFETAPGVTRGPTGSFAFQVHDNGGTANGGFDTDQTPNTVTYTIVKPADAAGASNEMARVAFALGGDAILADHGGGDAGVFDGAVTRAMLLHDIASNAAVTHFDPGGTADDFGALVDAMAVSVAMADEHGDAAPPAVHPDLAGIDWAHHLFL